MWKALNEYVNSQDIGLSEGASQQNLSEDNGYLCDLRTFRSDF